MIKMVTKASITHIASLAKLEFTEDETLELVKTFNNILGYIKKIKDVDTGSVQPLAHISELSNVYRDDVVEASLDREKILGNAPDSAGGCFRVPKVM